MSFLRKVKSSLGIGKTLYVPDCTTKFKTPHIHKNYLILLEKAGVKHIELHQHICSGDIAIDTGYKAEFERIRAANQALFDKHNITKIITNCPEALRTFQEFYDIDAEHITETLVNANISIEDTPGSYTYHDPCNLARATRVRNAPRTLLKKAGIDVKELPHSHDDAICCGGYLLDHQPILAEECARKCANNAKAIVTSSPRCYLHLKEHLTIPVFELSEVIK